MFLTELWLLCKVWKPKCPVNYDDPDSPHEGCGILTGTGKRLRHLQCNKTAQLTWYYNRFLLSNQQTHPRGTKNLEDVQKYVSPGLGMNVTSALLFI